MPPLNNVKVQFIDIRSKSGKLVCRLDFARQLLEWKEGRDYDLIDLPAYYERVTGKKLDDSE